ncbi:mitochondrial outer membrane protein porin 4 [Tanacetum coccineum]
MLAHFGVVHDWVATVLIDLFTKDYRCDNEISFSFHGSTPLELISGLVTRQNTRVSRRLTFDEVMPHTKAVVSFEVPNPRSGQLDVQYRHPRVYIDACLGLNRSPVLNLKAAVDYKDVALGGEVGFDAASTSFTKYTAAIGLPQFGATLLLMDKGKTLKATYVHSINGSDKNQITAELAHRFSSSENIITLRSAHVIDRYNTVKTMFSNNGKVSLMCQHEWQPKSFITVSAEYDIIRTEVSPKWGLAIALNGLMIGHLLLKIPAAANEVRSVLREASISRSFCKNRVIGVESDDGGDDGLPLLNKRHNTSLVIMY